MYCSASTSSVFVLSKNDMSRFSDLAMPPRSAILVSSLATRDLVIKSAYKVRGASYHCLISNREGLATSL